MTIERRRAINRLSSEAGGIFIAYRDDSRSQGRRFVDGIGIRRLAAAGVGGALVLLAGGGAPPPAPAGPPSGVHPGRPLFRRERLGTKRGGRPELLVRLHGRHRSGREGMPSVSGAIDLGSRFSGSRGHLGLASLRVWR